MLTETIAVLAWFQLKHFAADYMLQPHWILRGKGSLFRGGGYAHAAIHAVGSLPAYVVAMIDPSRAALLMAAEFAVHYAIDFGKSALSERLRSGPDTQGYWTLHGADQLLHQFTYVCLLIAVAALGSH